MFQSYTNLSDAPHTQPRMTGLLCVGTNIMPLSWHMPISREPFRYLVAVRAENHTHTLIHQKETFTLNFLPFMFHEKIDACGRVHGRDGDKLGFSGFLTNQSDAFGNILLDAADFIYECRVYKTSIEGDHTLFYVDIPLIHVNNCYEERPTLFLGRGRYTTICKPVQIK